MHAAADAPVGSGNGDSAAGAPNIDHWMSKLMEQDTYTSWDGQSIERGTRDMEWMMARGYGWRDSEQWTSVIEAFYFKSSDGSAFYCINKMLNAGNFIKIL